MKRFKAAGKVEQIRFVSGTHQGEAEKHIEKLANTVRALGAQVNPTGAMFWVADFSHPADTAYNSAMIEYQEAVAAYKAGGSSGVPYTGK